MGMDVDGLRARWVGIGDDARCLWVRVTGKCIVSICVLRTAICRACLPRLVSGHSLAFPPSVCTRQEFASGAWKCPTGGQWGRWRQLSGFRATVVER